VLQKEQKNYQADKKSFLLLEAIIAIVVISIALSLFFDSKVAISNYLNMLVKREELDKLFWQASYDFANPTLIKTSTNITKTTKSINCYIKKAEPNSIFQFYKIYLIIKIVAFYKLH
jgi:hypothetical protein